MAKFDYYLILEVKRSDSHETIKRSYRRLARKHHPDQNQGNLQAEERFKRIVEAWEVLGDAERRRMYDLFGHRAGDRGFPSYPGTELNPIDVFDELLKKVREDLKRRLFKRKGRDLQIDVTLTMREALLGTDRIFELPRLDAAGEVTRRRFEVRVPRGVPQGRVLRWKEQGAPGVHGGKSGDLLVRVLIETHPIFRFEGGELVVDLYLYPEEARKGVSVAIPSPWGARTFAVPAETDDGALLEARLLGGLDEAGNRRSLWLKVHVEAPSDTSPKVPVSDGSGAASADAAEQTSNASSAHAKGRERLNDYVRALHEGKA